MLRQHSNLGETAGDADWCMAANEVVGNQG
jgi:hypothetical protein